MPKPPRTYKAILSEIARGDRSSLFCWLVDHHDEIIEQAAGKRMRWEPLCKRFAEHGLTDINGRPATPRTAREAWFQARKAVAEAKKRKQASDSARRPGAVYPSRISPEWRPTVVPQRPVTPITQQANSVPQPVAAPAATGPVTPDPRIDPTLPPSAQDSLRRLFKDFDDVANSRLKF